MIPSLRFSRLATTTSLKSFSLATSICTVTGWSLNFNEKAIPEMMCCSSTTHGSTSTSTSLLKPTLPLLKPMRRRRLPVREPQAGDWLCSCGHSNSKFRRDCIKCNGPAPPLPLGESRPKLPGEDPHDWACACGKMNYRGNVNCHKCGMPKPATPEAEQKNQMWKCAKCACLNRINRKFCFQCRALQTVSAVPVNQDGKTVQ